MLASFSLGGVPVLHRPNLNPSLLKVYDNPSEAGSTSLLSLRCLPAGYVTFPM